MAYYFCLDEMELPVTPSKLQLKIKNKNETLTLINGQEINIPQKAGLSEIEFECIIPQSNYPFIHGAMKRASYYLDVFEQLKKRQAPFVFKVVRTLPNGRMLFDTEMKTTLEEYSVTEDAKEGLDLIVSVKLKQYVDYATRKTLMIHSEEQSEATVHTERPSETSPAPKTSAKTYTVVKGDTLWAIAKKFYGNGSQYIKVANANRDKIQNPNRIRVGQVLTIPV